MGPSGMKKEIILIWESCYNFLKTFLVSFFKKYFLTQIFFILLLVFSNTPTTRAYYFGGKPVFFFPLCSEFAPY